jgi:predicted O-linked N-acetylglucosamine transferase (SPINDLY family)
MQALQLTPIDPAQKFESAYLEQTVSYYEAIIDRGEESSQNYWDLGLAYLLQKREVDAQATWFIPFARASEIEIESLTDDLSNTLDRVASQKMAAYNLDDAWSIGQYLREANPAHTNNLLRSILIEIKFGRFKPEVLIELKATEILVNATNINVDRELLINLLESMLSFPSDSVYIFIRQCLSIFKDDCLDIISAIINTSLSLAHRLGGNLFLIEILETCLKVKPDNIGVLNAIARLHCNLGQHRKAISISLKAYDLCVKSIERIITNVAVLKTMLAAGDWANVFPIFQRHYQLLEDFLIEEHNFLEPGINQALTVSAVFLPCIEDKPEYFRPLQNRIAQKHIEYSQVSIISNLVEPISLTKLAGVIRIGYLGSTLKKHSVGWLSRWLWQYHDRNKFQIFTYCINQNPDDSFHQKWFRDCSNVTYCCSDNADEISAQIQADEIDILIDLDCLSLSLTCRILATKPAPVQVSWLGWDATGLPTVDYFIADPYVLPDNAQEYYQEKIWRLPQTYLAVKGFEIGIPTLKRRDLKIPDDALVYWSGQSGFKRHPDTVRLQLRILKSVPNSYFLIKGDTDPTIIQEFFGQLASEEGVEFDRLRFLGNVADEQTHRANLAIADVVLDTFPYNGATTTLETLWMGIPMVTQVGQQFAARNSYTFMLNAGIDEGIAWSPEEYVEWGIKLGLDRELRLEIRDKLRLGRTTAPVWNAKQFTLDMEEAYRQMWAIYQEQQQEVSVDYSHN